MSLFRASTSQEQEQAMAKYHDSASKHICKVPETMLERKISCSKCKKPCLVRHRFCSECGTKNADFDEQAQCVMARGRRKGSAKVRPSEFDVEALMADHFKGLKVITAAGQEALGGGTKDSSSDSSDSSADGEQEGEAPPLPAYDPPTVVAAQLKTAAGVFSTK